MSISNVGNIVQSTMWLLLCSLSICFGQAVMPTSRSMKALEVGDIFPNLTISSLMNNRGEPLHVADYNDRLLVIDFWATGCGSCVVALPKLAKLQKQFGSQIKILPVTAEHKQQVQAFWTTNNNLRSLDLPTVVEDTLLSKYIRHRFVSHVAWIYKGKVVALTGVDYVDSNTVKRVLSGEKINFPLKYDYYNFDFEKPLFSLDSNQIDRAQTSLEYVAISGHRKGISSDGMGGFGIRKDTLNKSVRVYIANASIYSAYIILSNSAGLMKHTIQGFSPNQVVWEVANRDQYQWRNKELSGYRQDWEYLNSFCYESLRPDTGQTNGQLYFQAMLDLNQLLGINVRWEKRFEHTFVLKYDVSAKQKILKEGLSSINLVNSMNQNEQSPYVFDESGGNIIIPQAIASFKSIDSISRSLKPYGLKLEQQNREVYKLVFSEKVNFLLPDGKLTKEFQKRKAIQVGLKNADSLENLTFLDHNKKLPEVVLLTSGLQYRVIRKGIGRRPLLTDKVKIHYTGMQVNGKIFESTEEGGIPSIVKLTDLIPGLVEGVSLMQEGAKWFFYVPAALAYGDHTAEGKIPKNSTLVFEVELLQVLR